MAVSFNLPDPYEAQKADIARRQKYAEALQQQAFQPVEIQSYQGIQAPIPVAAGLAKALQGLMGGYFAGQARDEARELREGDIKKGQEFAAALQGAKTPEERQALATTALGGTLGQRAQAMAGPLFSMAETAREKELAREAAAQKARDDRLARAEIAEANRQLQASVAGMAAGQRQAALDLQRDLGMARREDQRAESERRAAQLSPQEQKELFDTLGQESAARDSVSALREARSLSDKFGGGRAGTALSWAERQAASMVNISPSESAKATEEFNNIVGQEVLNKLRATFGGNPTNAEREVLTKLQASAYEERSVRNALLDRAIKMAEEREKSSASKADTIRTREYRQPSGARPAAQPAAAAAPAPAGGQQPRPVPAGGQQPAAPRRLRFNPETGNLE
jgi:hypothetical protein